MTRIQRVGFLGLGIMGVRMARNLAQKGFHVVAWNRTPSKVAELAAYGVEAAQTPKELAQKVDAICTCVATPQALGDVTHGVDGLLQGVRKGQLYIDFSTVSPDMTCDLETTYASLGVDMVEAPVTGSKAGADKGTLVIMAGGTNEAVARAQPIFEAVGEKVIHCGPMGHGSYVKLAGNALIASMLQGVSEGMLFVKKAGVDVRKFLEVVQSSGYRSPYFDAKGQAILNRNFDTQFSIDLMFKDLTLFWENARAMQVPVPATSAVRDTYQLSRTDGNGHLDIAAVVTSLEKTAGVILE